MSPASKPTADRVRALAREIRTYCKKNAQPSQADKWARYFKEGYDSWGLLDREHPIWNQQQAKWAKKYQDIGLPGFLKLGELLFTSGKYEEGSLAIGFVKPFREKLTAKTLPRLGEWFAAGICNWAHTDVLCGELIGPVLADRRAPLEALAKWRESKHKFQRRAVPVSMLDLLKAGEPVPRLLDFIRPLMLDEERVVGQGLGWLLRECWKKEPEPVEAFLLEYKDKAQRVIFQYATEKMPKQERLKFRKTKKAK